MSEFENPPQELEFEEDFDDLELQAIFAASLASVTGRYDSTARDRGYGVDLEPL